MKRILMISILVVCICSLNAQTNSPNTSFYSLKSETIDERTFDFSTLRGKKVLIVNTASKCGYTPQYKELEQLYKTFGGEKFVILGFPANNFKEQEPGTNDDIKEFCRVNYGVTFQMMSKISVKGDDISPVYQWLTQKKLNGKLDSEVAWNFQKYMIDENGNLVDFAESKISPLSDKIVNWIKGN